MLDEAEQGNWTAWLCSVAFRNRSQKFSKSSSSWSEVFSKTASTSVDTMLYTTKKDGCGRGRRRVVTKKNCCLLLLAVFTSCFTNFAFQSCFIIAHSL